MAQTQAHEPTTQRYVQTLWDVDSSDLPSETVAMTKRLTADLIGCSVAGQRSPELDAVLDLAREQYAAGPASIFGDPDRLSPIGAALANATTGHGWDFDDTYDASPLHTSSSVVPATLALAQRTGATGAEILRAAALGMETHVRLALACDTTIMDQGWHRTALHGTFGATVAAAAILDLDVRTAENALSIAYSQTAGHIQVTEGGATKRFQPGHASSSAVTAALLADKGLSGPPDPWFGRFGFYETYESNAYDDGIIFEDLGESWYVPDLSLKPYPCCRYMHTVIDAGLELREEHGLSLSDIERATVYTNADGHTACAEPPEPRYQPETFIHLQFNLPYALALPLVDGRPRIEHFTSDAVPRANDLPLERIETAVTDEFDAEYADKISPARVVVETTDGRSLEVTKIDPKGHPNNRMDDTEFRTKLEDCVAFSGLSVGSGVVADLLDLVEDLEHLEEAEPIMALLEG
ncbi:MAG: MmgE/PrpD family protein [Salinirussus sp.]